MFWNKKKEKTIEEKIAEFSYEQAREAFSLRSGEDVSLEELQARYAHWKDNSSGKSDHTWQLMNHAYSLLITPLSKAAWEQIPPSSITLKEAFKVFGMERDEKAQQLSSSDVPKQLTLNTDFGYRSRWFLSTIEDAQRLDAAYYALYQHAKPHQYAKNEPMEPPCSLRFQAIIARERAAGWDSPKIGKWEITDKEAHAVFGIEDVGKITPPEVTALFKDFQTRCTTVEEAEKLDLAYRWLFMISCRFEKDFTVSIASPYAPVLAKKLGQPLPVMAQTQQKEVTRASGLPVGFPPDPAPLSVDEQKDECIVSLWETFYKTKEVATGIQHSSLLVHTADTGLQLLKSFRKSFASNVQDQVVEEDEVTESPVLPLVEEVAQPEEAAPVPVSDLSVEEALRVFVLERNDEFDEEELTARYEDKSAITDSKAAQVKIDTAYQVLKAHLKAQKEVAYQQERTLLGYGSTETFTRKDLKDRYTRLSKDNDSKAKQKILDEAYQVLLKIVA